MTATTGTTGTTGLRTFTIDKAHSEATFQVRHLITKVRGRFSDFQGTLQFDEAKPEQSSVSFTIKTSSIDTSEADRDKHLRSADFFSVDEHPTITFTSTRVRKIGGQQFEVVGPLTIRGTRKEITIPVTYLGGAKDPWGKERAGFEAELTLNRKDFGLSWNAPLEAGGFLVGDEVKINLSIQAVAT
jgi:polyisoprenoid-binding protein YceI